MQRKSRRRFLVQDSEPAAARARGLEERLASVQTVSDSNCFRLEAESRQEHERRKKTLMKE